MSSTRSSETSFSEGLVTNMNHLVHIKQPVSKRRDNYVIDRFLSDSYHQLQIISEDIESSNDSTRNSPAFNSQIDGTTEYDETDTATSRQYNKIDISKPKNSEVFREQKMFTQTNQTPYSSSDSSASVEPKIRTTMKKKSLRSRSSVFHPISDDVLNFSRTNTNKSGNSHVSLKDNFLGSKQFKKNDDVKLGINQPRKFRQLFLEQTSPVRDILSDPKRPVDRRRSFQGRRITDKKSTDVKDLMKSSVSLPRDYSVSPRKKINEVHHTRVSLLRGGFSQNNVTDSRLSHHKDASKHTTFLSPTTASYQRDVKRQIDYINRYLSPTRKRIQESQQSQTMYRLSTLNELIPFKEIGDQVDSRLTYRERLHGSVVRSPSKSPIRSSVTSNSMSNKNDDISMPDTKENDFGSVCATDSTTTLNPDSKHPVSDALEKLKNDEWDVALRGLADIVELSHLLEYERILPHMTTVYQRLITLLRSPRSYVCRTTCQISALLFGTMKYTRRPEFDDIVDTLLAKTADASKFIREDSSAALDSMVTHIAPFHSVRALCAKGPVHKNALVRVSASRLLMCVIAIMGNDSIFSTSTNEMVRKKLITNTCTFLTDSNTEARKNGEKMYKLLSMHPDFNTNFKMIVDKNTMVRLKNILKTLNRKK